MSAARIGGRGAVRALSNFSLLIAEAHRPRGIAVEIGRFWPIHFLDIRLSGQQQARRDSSLPRMRLKDEQEVAAQDGPISGRRADPQRAYVPVSFQTLTPSLE
jgi:hypothetical protein